jgi:hypothetical protein
MSSKPRSSKNYVTTVKMTNPVDRVFVEQLRQYINETNHLRKVKQRVVLRGRLGHDNPAAPYYYNQPTWFYNIKIQHSERSDVYIYERR